MTDSQLVGGQAKGSVGSSAHNEPYCHLRAAFQALEAMLPGDNLRVARTRSHAGEPFNELVDFFAKLEGRNSLYLPRQQVNMQTFGRILRILWIILSQDGDLPTLCGGGLAIIPPQVPTTMVCTDTPEEVHNFDKMTISLSFASANVRTFYRGQDGVPGKLHYVRE